MATKTNPKVWDGFLTAHFADWLQRTIRQCDRPALDAKVKAFVTEHPDVIERGLGWTQIAEMANRKL